MHESFYEIDYFFLLGKASSKQDSLKRMVSLNEERRLAIPKEVNQNFARCSILANNRIVFRIKGNDYRVIVEMSYEFKAVYICFVGTHAEYDKVDASTVYIR